MKTPRWLLLAAFVALVPLSATLPFAQDGTASAGADSAPAEPKAPEDAARRPAPIQVDYMETVEVGVLQVNVLVTDRDGKPVLDLKKDDLEVRIGRREAQIAYVDRNATSGPPLSVIPDRNAGATPATAPEGAVASDQAGESPAEARRWIVLVLDRYTTSMRTRSAAAKAVAQWIASEMREGDRVSLVAFDGKMRVVRAFTTDKNELTLGIGEIERSPGVVAPDRPSALKSLALQVDNCTSYGDPITCAQGHMKPYEDELARERRFVMSALTLLTRSLASIPDIKTVLFFSDGFAHNPSEDGLNVVQALLGFKVRTRIIPSYRPDHDHDYRMLAEAASLARTSIFTIFPGGASDMGMSSASQRGPVSEVTGTETIDYFARSAANFEYGLADVALRTGGVPTTRGDAFEAVKDTLQRAEGLYTIGIYTSGLSQYRDYDIDIRSKRKDLRFTKERVVPRLRRAKPLGGSLKLIPEVCSSDGRRGLALELDVDKSTLTFVRSGKVLAANFAVFALIYDPETQEVLHEDYRFLSSTQDEAGGAASLASAPRIEQRLLVPCRPLSVVVTVTDAESGARGRFVQSID